ncbi:MAG: hypothetical protein ACKVE3_09570 [Dissulfuribacterales bacterium]
MMIYINILLVCLLSACQPPFMDSSLGKSGCRRCHDVQLDPAHDIGCRSCHHGRPEGYSRAQAHKGLIPMPSHPSLMARTCGKCHAGEVTVAGSSIHFTLSGMIGTVWSGFFPGEQVPTLLELPIEEPPCTERGLVSDALRRRCLRCHVYYQGDDYTGTARGTGCAACHLGIRAERPWDHRFRRKVPDTRCLSCHYGNFVGWDYYGRFEMDYEDDYRVPLVEGEHIQRPYGMEWHNMTPDVHRTAGMVCTDCHCSGPCGDEKRDVKCLDCHLGDKTGSHPGPPMDRKRIGHRPEDADLVACAACHGLWAVRDRGRSLIRQDMPDFDDWSYLAVQGSSEIEAAVKNYVNLPYEDWIIPRMVDKITGEYRQGLWFESFTERRWSPVKLGEDAHGRLVVIRPVLDLSLSYVDSDGVVRFDNLRPKTVDDDLSSGNAARPDALSFWLPYSPHTIGPSDAFRTIYVQSWLNRRLSESNDVNIQ